MMFSSPKSFPRTAGSWAAVFIVFFVTSCGGSAPAVAPAERPAPVAIPSLDIISNEGGLLTIRTAGGHVFEAGPGGRPSFLSTSQDGRYAVVAVTAEDASRLYAFDRASENALLLHSGNPDLVYSGDWSEETGKFAFGFYIPVGRRMGTGDIRLFEPGDTRAESVGCSASRAVETWLPDGDLMVRDSENLYVVEPAGCRTLRTIDARKMHHLIVSPNGRSMAYIIRELVYDRDNHTYEPDSILYVSATGGGDPIKVLGDKYTPRNFEWSPDGAELAFDAELQDGSRRRAVSIFNLESSQSSYLTPPASGSSSQEKPSWSPSGARILYRSTDLSGDTRYMYRTTGEQFSRTIPWPEKTESYEFASWVDDNTILATSASGTSLLVDVERGVEIYRSGGMMQALPRR